MAERALSLTNIIDGLALEAAEASDLAFDELHRWEDRVTRTQLAVGYAALNGDVLADLEQQRDEAQHGFDKLIGVAADLMGHEASSFSVPAIGALPIAAAEADSEVAELPEILSNSPEYQNLSPEYRGAAETSYRLWEQLVRHAIQGGQLSENYALPAYSEFLEPIVALAPTYEVMTDEKWQPDVVFVPKGLSPERWNALFQLSGITNDSKSFAFVYRCEQYEVENYDELEAGDTEPWGIAVISSSKHPAITEVSKDGKKLLPASRRILKKLSRLPSVTDTSSLEAVIRQTSPSQAVYLAMQMTRLQRGKKPADRLTRTIGKEWARVGCRLTSLCFDVEVGDIVNTRWIFRDAYDLRTGLRPAVEYKDLDTGS